MSEFRKWLEEREHRLIIALQNPFLTDETRFVGERDLTGVQVLLTHLPVDDDEMIAYSSGSSPSR